MRGRGPAPRLDRPPKPEVFVGPTLGHEGAFEGPVVYHDAGGRCHKAWVQRDWTYMDY